MQERRPGDVCEQGTSVSGRVLQTTGSGILVLLFKLSGGGHPPPAATNSQKGTSFHLWEGVGEPRTSPPTQGDALPYIRRKHPASGSDRSVREQR